MLLFLLLSSLLAAGSSFNIDTETPYIVYGTGDEYFGFSVALHKKDGVRKLLVGAPKAQTAQQGVESPGTVYQCTIPDSIPSRRSPVSCRTRIDAFDGKGNKYLFVDSGGFPEANADGTPKYNYDYRGYQQENKTEQWMGVSLQSTGENVVACAHRYVNLAYYYSKPGKPYDTQPVGKCTVISGDLSTQESEYVPCWGRTTGYEQSSCQAGTSAALSNGALVFGGPGAGKGLGKAFMSTDFSSSETINTGSHGDEAGQWYTGYSVAICDVNGDGTDDTITAAPRAATYMGKLFVYSKTGNVLTKHVTIDGFQIGEYFGFSMDCGDVNGDGVDDIIIGAPFYSRDTSGQARLSATGRVYVYYGDRENYLQKTPTILDGEIDENAQFGHAVKVVGDMNQDGFKDVMVGAPYLSNGIGKVYLYLGSINGLETEFSQSITPGDLQEPMTTFGYSIDGGTDMDDNDYPDILVGTMNGYATYLRALPIIDLNATISITPDKPIDMEDVALIVDVPDDPPYKAVAVDVKICFTYIKGIVKGSSQDMIIRYTLTADYKNPKGFRMYFKPSRDEPKTQTMSGQATVSTSGAQVCTIMFKSYFNAEIYDMRHIYFKLEASVDEEKYFEKRVTLNQQMIDSAEKRVVMQSGCTNPDGICQADLVLSPVTYTISPKGWDAIALGRTDYVLFNINVTNKGPDDAFLSELTLVLPNNVIFNRKQAIGDGDVEHIKCITKQREDDGNNMVICSLSSQLAVNSYEVFGISVITSGIETLAQKMLNFKFEAYVQEPSEELNILYGDNVQDVQIQVGYPADIELRGRPLRERQPYNNNRKIDGSVSTAKSIGPDVRHELEVYIKEESHSHEYHAVDIQGMWPLYYPGSQTYLLDLYKYAASSDNVECSFGRMFNIETQDNYQVKKPPDVRRKRVRSERSGSMRDNMVEDEDDDVSTTLSDSLDTDMANTMDCSVNPDGCEKFSCSISKLEKNKTLTIQFLSVLNTYNVNSAQQSGAASTPSLNIIPYFYIIALAEQHTNMIIPKPTKGSPSEGQLEMVKVEETKSDYGWIIIVSIIIGLLLLVVITVILVCCCGFCKRDYALIPQDIPQDIEQNLAKPSPQSGGTKKGTKQVTKQGVKQGTKKG